MKINLTFIDNTGNTTRIGEAIKSFSDPDFEIQLFNPLSAFISSDDITRAMPKNGVNVLVVDLNGCINFGKYFSAADYTLVSSNGNTWDLYDRQGNLNEFSVPVERVLYEVASNAAEHIDEYSNPDNSTLATY